MHRWNCLLQMRMSSWIWGTRLWNKYIIVGIYIHKVLNMVHYLFFPKYLHNRHWWLYWYTLQKWRNVQGRNQFLFLYLPTWSNRKSLPIKYGRIVSIIPEWISLNRDFYVLDIDDCRPNPCKNDGVCVDHINSVTCNCGHGYTGDDCSIGIIVIVFVLDNVLRKIF